ncbi:hypothetical protein PMZ80_004552 [Knufia obscura]|uniref:F-box domain-containing protein n=1 Tax=Knufia obscura TaxID=1635080 RepID=A0ABR0RSF1_9EURO|nr:hypothetical protein PMZ80_004552 [Knufia obscura]
MYRFNNLMPTKRFKRMFDPLMQTVEDQQTNITDLPAEVLRFVLEQHFAELAEDINPFAADRRPIFAAMQVCKQWRATACSIICIRCDTGTMMSPNSKGQYNVEATTSFAEDGICRSCKKMLHNCYRSAVFGWQSIPVPRDKTAVHQQQLAEQQLKCLELPASYEAFLNYQLRQAYYLPLFHEVAVITHPSCSDGSNDETVPRKNKTLLDTTFGVIGAYCSWRKGIETKRELPADHEVL